ncbi:LamG domain-containing protein [Flammeovirga sp. SJP92]|uniref:LamG domain-containing protein n=1 Tax=Flammeovirga sp. SJP92 TaxID=1775430 RepID=UPI000786D7A0|nr:LamG domain-containing protein [Flammeovirga sp. SJP92]KXX71829.1 hypothetical protein AVL50_03325 [Flammeovirga sp. SJP92]
MFKCYFAFLTIVCFFKIINTEAQVVERGLIGYWEFNGKLMDESVNSNNGTPINAPSFVKDRFENESQAIFFNGSNSFVDFGDVLIDGLNNFSFSVWVKPNFLISNPGNSGHSANENAVLHKVGGADDNLGFTLTAERVAFYIDNGADNTIFYESSPQLGTWTHYAGTFGSGLMNLYVNGQLVSSSSVSTASIIDNTNSLRLGGYHPNAADYFFKGSIDQLMLFNQVLTAEEVELIYRDGSSMGNDCSALFCDGNNIGIGIADTHGYKLAVAGKTITEEVNVSLVEHWPDYVFEETYNLRSLENIEKYISDKGHLPEIPSETEVANKGIDLGKMNAKLLQKIEELTLYLIEQNHQNKLQQAQIEELEKKISQLQNK